MEDMPNFGIIFDFLRHHSDGFMYLLRQLRSNPADILCYFECHIL